MDLIDPANLNEAALIAAAPTIAIEQEAQAAEQAAKAKAETQRLNRIKNRDEIMRASLIERLRKIGINPDGVTFAVKSITEPSTRQAGGEYEDDDVYTEYVNGQYVFEWTMAGHEYVGSVSFWMYDDYGPKVVASTYDSIQIAIISPKSESGKVWRCANNLIWLGKALDEERRYLATRRHPQRIPEDPDPETTEWHRQLVDQASGAEAEDGAPVQEEGEPDPRCSPSHIRRFEVDASGATLVVCLHCHLPPSQEE